MISHLQNVLDVDSHIKLYCPIKKRWIHNKILVGYSSILRLHFIVEHKSKSTNDYVQSDISTEYDCDSLIYGGGFYKNDGQKIGEMELWTFLSYNNLDIVKHLQGEDIRKNKSNTLKLSMLLSGIKPINY